MTAQASAVDRIRHLETRLGYEPTSRNHLTIETRLETLEWKTGSRIRRQTATDERLEILERNVAKMRRRPRVDASEDPATGPVASRTRQADSNERLNQAGGSERSTSPQPKRTRSRDRVDASGSSPAAATTDGPAPKRTRSREKLQQASADAGTSSAAATEPPRRTRSREKMMQQAGQGGAAEQEGQLPPKTRSREKLSRSRNELSGLGLEGDTGRPRPVSRGSNRSVSPNSRAAQTLSEPPPPLAPPPGLSVQNALQLARARKKASHDRDAAENGS